MIVNRFDLVIFRSVCYTRRNDSAESRGGQRRALCADSWKEHADGRLKTYPHRRRDRRLS